MATENYIKPNYNDSSQTGTGFPNWPLNVDNAMHVHHEVAGAFAVHETTPPSLAVEVEPPENGLTYTGGSWLNNSMAISSPLQTVPTNYPRLDLVLLDPATNTISIANGLEIATPATPTVPTDFPPVPAGLVPIAYYQISPTTTAITNGDLCAIRGVPYKAVLSAPIETGTKMAFFQAAAPIGWTQDTTNNDAALRVVSTAGGGTGGTHGVSSPPSTAHDHDGPSHTHTVTMDSDPGHFHTLPIGGEYGAITFDYTYTSGTVPVNMGIGSVGVSGTRAQLRSYSDGARNHDHGGLTGTDGIGKTSSNGPTAFSPKYVDVIICSRDAA